MNISLERAIPAQICTERRLQFAIDNSMLQMLVDAFHVGQLAVDIPSECKLHSAAQSLLQHSRTLREHDCIENMVIFVDGSYLPKQTTCSWAFAAFAVKPQEIIWLGYMAGIVPDVACGEIPSAFRAELFAQLMAHLFAAAQPCDSVTLAYDATSASSVAAGDCNVADDDALARRLVAAGMLVRSQGKAIRQVHVKSHTGQPGNELVDGLASFTAERGVDMRSPASECVRALLEESLLEWLWLLPQTHRSIQFPALAEDGAFVADSRVQVCGHVWETPEELRPQSHESWHSRKRPQSGEGHSMREQISAKLRLMTYNALSLKTHGQDQALSEEMRRHGVSVLALQECREVVEQIRIQGGICKLAGPALDGHFGCQIWVDCEQVIGHRKDGTPITWDRQAFTVLHADPRVLVVGGRAATQKLAIVSAHACTNVTGSEERNKIWRRICNAVKSIPRGHIPLLLIDANARFEHGTEQPVDGCKNAHRLKELVQRHDLWLSGNIDKFGKPLITWIPPGHSSSGTCIDYIAVPRTWSLGAEVIGDPGLLDVHAGFDHFPVAVDIVACVEHGSRDPRSVCIDVEQLYTPEGQAKAEAILASVPSVPWHVDCDSHLACVNQYMATHFAAAFPRRCKPRNPCLSEVSWQIIAQRRQTRRHIVRSQQLQKKLFLNECYQAWKDVVAGQEAVRSYHGRRSKMKFNRARAVKILNELNALLKKSVRRDEANFIKRMFGHARQEGAAQLQGLIRAVLKTGRRYRAPQTSPCLHIKDIIISDASQVKLELGRHFAKAERASEVPFCAMQQTWPQQSQEIEVDATAMPTIGQIASAFAGMRSRRAPGISGLPADVFKVCPAAAAKLHAPLYFKMLARKSAAILWRGCLVTTVPKPNKPQHALSGHRSIALQEPASKALAKAMRGAISRALDQVAPLGMAGGRKGKPMAIPAITVQAHLGKLIRLRRTGAVLFLDGANAFYAVSRAFFPGFSKLPTSMSGCRACPYVRA